MVVRPGSRTQDARARIRETIGVQLPVVTWSHSKAAVALPRQLAAEVDWSQPARPGF